MRAIYLLIGSVLLLNINVTFAGQLSTSNTLLFDGLNNYININDVTNDITGNAMSVEFRFKTDVEPNLNTDNQLITFQGVTDNVVLGIGIGMNGSIAIKTNTGTVVKGGGYNDNKWHVLSVVITASNNNYVFVDGVKSFEYNTDIINLNLFNRCSIGQEYNLGSASHHFSGKISELRIWNKLLTIETIGNNLCNQLTGSESDLIALYNFENSSGGTTLIDNSPNNNTGLIMNIDVANDWIEEDIICDNTVDDLVQFSVVGDAPYDAAGSTVKLDLLTSHILENNDKSYADLIIHVGDIKTGTTPCDTFYYENVKNLFKQSTVHPYLITGDNEWNDCSDHAAALSIWHTNFDSLNTQFKTDLNANSQSVRNENIAFIKNSVLFITINQVGGRYHDPNEWKQRMTDNADWIDENLTKYKNFIRASVIYAQARPNVRINDVGDTTFFIPFLASVEAFGKPVLYIQGDSHVWNQQFNYGGKANLLKVVIDSDSRTDNILQVVVTKDPSETFYFDRQAFASVITGNSSLTVIDSTTVSISWETDSTVESVVRYGLINMPLVYRAENLTPKTNHLIEIPNLINGTTYRFEVGTKTARLDTTDLVYKVPIDTSSPAETIIYENNFSDSITVFPNPTDGIVTILRDNSTNHQYRIEIIDLLGRIVSNQQIKSTLDIKRLNSGVYILKIYSPITGNPIHNQLIIKK